MMSIVYNDRRNLRKPAKHKAASKMVMLALRPGAALPIAFNAR
jgi:hypothetical protein